FSMRIFNADGSQAQMCGNATRCIGLYVHEKGLTDKTDISLETLSGIKHIRLHMDADGQVGAVSVDMGPFRCAETLQEVSAAGRTFAGRIVDVGNPHFVVFADEGAQAQIDRFGPGIEHAPLFPRRTNVEFARLTAPGHIRMRVWERGSGITMACGTGACATAVAARKAGLTGDRCTVEMDGGSLEIGIGADGHIRMTGGARIVFEGTIHV
ncbi:MAG: diaminopimelate epimerase, partial [Bacteroidales bacterium]|nr:diaminopimelate epimerase [Bacteroidales bacterium]